MYGVVSVRAVYFAARHRFPGRTAFLYLVLVTQMLAPVALVVGLYRQFIEVGGVNQYIQVWNEFVVALTLFNEPAAQRQTLTVGIQQLVGLYQTQYQFLFVASLIAIVPVVVLFATIERHLVGGLTAGSVR